MNIASGRLRLLQVRADIAKEGLDRTTELLRTRQVEWERRREAYQEAEEAYGYWKRELGLDVVPSAPTLAPTSTPTSTPASVYQSGSTSFHLSCICHRSHRLVLEILKHIKEGSAGAPEFSGLDLGRLNLGHY